MSGDKLDNMSVEEKEKEVAEETNGKKEELVK
jgi:hypothetical protein